MFGNTDSVSSYALTISFSKHRNYMDFFIVFHIYKCLVRISSKNRKKKLFDMWVCLFRPFEVHMANKMNSFMDSIEIKLLFVVVVFQYPCLLSWIERHQRTTVWKRLYCASRKMHKMLNKQLFLCHQSGEYMRHYSVDGWTKTFHRIAAVVH